LVHLLQALAQLVRALGVFEVLWGHKAILWALF
jgi:hypothetical protein